ncbi:MAG: RNase P subunit p30 family protein [Candidatus Aenigmatarchaeota archaeon]
MAYDLHVYTSRTIGENSLDEMISFAKKLGLKGLGIARLHTDKKQEFPETDIDLVDVVVIKAENGIDEIARRIRTKAEIIAVYGGKYLVNRQACESRYVDILLHPSLNRNDSGLDHVCVRAAADNRTAIEINFRQILEAYKKGRSSILTHMKRNIMLCKKFNTDVITTSSSLSKWNMRSARELASVAYLLGLDLGHAIDTSTIIPEEIVRINREKLAGKRWEGVIIE